MVRNAGQPGKVLVTGADGFMGRQICRHLIDRGHCLTPVVRAWDNSTCPGLAEVRSIGSICSETCWNEALQGVDTVVHLAARAHVLKENLANPLEEFRKINCDGTLNLARQMAENGVGRMVFISSIGVNGNSTRGVPFRESDPPDPKEPYAISKLEAEEGLWRISRDTGLEVVVIRPPLCYGPGVKGNFLRLIRWLEKGVPLPLGMVRNKRSFLNVANLCDLVEVCLCHPGAAGEVFLAADGNDISTPELMRMLAEAMGRKARLLPVPQAALERLLALAGKKDLAERLLGSLQVDISKAKRVLGWEPSHGMEQGMMEMASKRRRGINYKLRN